MVFMESSFRSVMFSCLPIWVLLVSCIFLQDHAAAMTCRKSTSGGVGDEDDHHHQEEIAGGTTDFMISPLLVRKEWRRTIAATDSGDITAVVIVVGRRRHHHQLHFITMEPSSLLLPLLLNTRTVFYVHSGVGTVTWVVGDDGKGAAVDSVDVEPGDVFTLEEGAVFYVKSHPNPTREKVRLHAFFHHSGDGDSSNVVAPPPYSSLGDLFRGFDDRVLQMGFRVSDEAVRGIREAKKPPAIVHLAPEQSGRHKDRRPAKLKDEVFEALLGEKEAAFILSKKSKKKKEKKKKEKGSSFTFNLLTAKPDQENCNGRSVAVTGKDFRSLEDINVGLFMVNLTRGAMMGPHWNPKAMEVAVVTQRRGMIQVICPSSNTSLAPPPHDRREREKSTATTTGCENSRFKVEEGDVFVVPKLHPMAQMSFNDGPFAFMGFATNAGLNHPQFLAGRRSVLRVIDRGLLAAAFGVGNSTVDELLASQEEAIMLECTSCAEELERRVEEEEEMERKKREEEEEEAGRRQEEETRRREDEEARKKREEEEEARKKREEEEEARKREVEEETKRREKEERRREEEEETRREEEQAREKEEERREEEEEREEKARREEEEREEKARIEEEEEARRREEEEARKREEEHGGEKEEEERREEEEREKEREEETKRREEEEEARREKERKREEEEARRSEEEEESTARKEGEREGSKKG